VIFEPAGVDGAFVVTMEPVEDERGWFARSFCQDEFREHGLDPCVAQSSVSFSARRGTLRGLHLQLPPHAEAKLVRCIHGALYDVILDLRTESATFGRWWAIELTAASHRSLYVPAGVAHGFQTLEPGTEVGYQMSHRHVPESASGVRWDDPAFEIEWPLEVTAISPADRARPDFALA
jgi:dTDP-4-dehydrorhamnose 3,5-epimerase